MILTPNGIPTGLFREQALSVNEAELFRRLKTFLARRDYREGLFCNRCQELSVSSGVHASVTDRQIRLACRCTTRSFSGATLP